MMTCEELRTKYLDFFRERGHAVIPSASLIPENDPTALFINSGMHPLVPFLRGTAHPEGTRLVNYQRCMRTTDIDEVGDATHNTFFEMLGNWSLGDYGKKESIEWSFEFLTSKKWLNIPIKKLAVTVFEGNALVQRDEESAEIWERLGIPKERIFFLGAEDNWWPSMDATGLCGPDTEIFFDRGEGPILPGEKPGSGDRFVEIWNNVFMEYDHLKDGSFQELPKKNVDTGMGLERTVAILNEKKSNYETDAFASIMEHIQRVATTPNEASERIIADHARATTFLIADGVLPSNVDQGYILRRLMRRAMRHADKIGIPKDTPILSDIAEIVIRQYNAAYPHLRSRRDTVVKEIRKEQEKFERTLKRGLREFSKLVTVTGKDAFLLFSTYGFPLELTEELLHERGESIDNSEFKLEFEEHQRQSKLGAEKKFKGGLADHSEMSVKYHTATHLLHEALQQVLGEHAEQRGSNITQDRLRFDFVHPTKMTPEEIQRTQDIVNEQIQRALPVSKKEMTVKEAKESGAKGIFEQKYGEKVSVYTIGDFSKEICGGPHVQNTSELGKFVIIKEQSSSSGIRRIKAVLEKAE